LNSLRFLLACLVRALILVAVLVVAGFAPTVQTWVAQWEISRQPGVTSTLGSFSARFGHLEISDLHLEAHGAVLTLPSLEATLPLTTAALNHRLLIGTLEAKGWTLDLSQTRKPAATTDEKEAPASGTAGEPAATASATPAQQAAAFFDRLLSEWHLPDDLVLDHADLEGDVLVPAATGRMPFRVHVTLQGGNLAAGRDGAFALTAAVADPRLPIGAVSAQGTLTVAMNSPRTIHRLEFKADLAARGDSRHRGMNLSADLSAARGAGGEDYALELSQDGRHLASVSTRYPAANRQLSGQWRLDLRDSDLTPFLLDQPLPTFAAAGEGHFEADTASGRVHAVGRLHAAGSRWEVLAPVLERLGPATLDANFDLAENGAAFHVDHLEVSLAGGRLATTVRALQAFDFDGTTSALRVADPAADWLNVSIQGFPLAWLSDPTSRFTFAGDVGGALVARSAAGGFTARAAAPLVATGVSLQGGERVLARDLNLSLPLEADYNPQGWKVRCAPLGVSRGGKSLGKIEATVAKAAGEDEPLTLSGTWQADLAALTAPPAILESTWISGRTASGDFSAKVGSSTEFEAKLTVVGRDPGHALTASVGGEADPGGGISFVAPVKITTGATSSELSAEGTWSGPGPESRFDFKLTSASVALDHLRLLAGPLGAAGGVPTAAGPDSGAQKDRVPFWGTLAGRVTVAFDQLTTPERSYDDVAGAIEVDPSALHLEGGRAGLARKRVVTAEGVIAFDPSAPLPYSLKATAGVDKVEAGSFFGHPPKGQDAMLDGNFALAGTFTGSGANWRDLRGRAQEEFRLTGTNGILRLLKTSVAEAIPEVATPVKDVLGSAGHAVQSFLEIKRNANSDKNPISVSAEAVLDFTTEVTEIGYDQLKVTVRRNADGILHLSDIAIISSDARLTGSGEIEPWAGRPIRSRPLSLELQFAAQGQVAELLARAKLLSGKKDDLGYSLLSRPVHFGGTLEQIDISGWHDLLAQAATREPPPKK
jgi:hypothetical protein